MAKPAERWGLPALFFGSFFWASKKNEQKELAEGTNHKK
jgi:hypothetical protein